MSGNQDRSLSGSFASTSANSNLRRVDLSSWHQKLNSLADLQEELEELQAQARDVSQQLEKRLQHHQQALQQQRQLAAARQIAEQHLRHARELQQQMQAQARRATAARQVIQAQAQALLRASTALHESAARLVAAQVELGSSGVQQWRALRDQLVTRRCTLAATLADIYQIGPKVVSEIPAGDLLEERMDWCWWTGVDSTISDDESISSAGLASTSSQHASSSYTAQYREVAKMVICDLEIPSHIGRRHLERDAVSQRGLWNDVHISAALGYVAHCVERLGMYLGVPTRYPVLFHNSTSCIMDAHAPMAVTDPQALARSQGREYNHLLASSQVWALHSDPWLVNPTSLKSLPTQRQEPCPRPTSYALHFSGTDPGRFAFATYLLSKNIEQLLVVHGLSPVGPAQMLHNLHKLLMLAKWTDTTTSKSTLPRAVGDSMQQGSEGGRRESSSAAPQQPPQQQRTGAGMLRLAGRHILTGIAEEGVLAV